MSPQLKVSIVIGLLSIVTMICAYIIIDNSTVFWGVFLMLIASRLDKTAAKILKDSREVRDLSNGQK